MSQSYQYFILCAFDVFGNWIFMLWASSLKAPIALWYLCTCMCVCEWGRNVYVCARIHAYDICVCVCACSHLFFRRVMCLVFFLRVCVPSPLLLLQLSWKEENLRLQNGIAQKEQYKVCVCLTWKVTEGPPQERAKNASLSAKMKQRRYLCIFDCAYVVSLFLLLTLGWSSRKESLEVCLSHGVSLGQMEPLVLLWWRQRTRRQEKKRRRKRRSMGLLSGKLSLINSSALWRLMWQKRCLCLETIRQIIQGPTWVWG